jgi:glyoxylase-like metal-dependent hydrolase (beta-lactamase superfamily II)
MAMIVDPGIDCKPAFDFIQGNGLTVEFIVNTHAHLDHAYGNHYMKTATGAPLLIHQADAPILEQIPAQAVSFGLPAPRVAEPDILLKDEAVIKLGWSSRLSIRRVIPRVAYVCTGTA